MRQQPLADVFEQLLLERDRAVAGGQGLVLELLQLRRDVPLGILHRLSADPRRGDFVAVRVGHLDVVAEHLVVADLQRADRRLGDEPRLVLGEPLLTVDGERAQAVELGVVAVGDDGAFAEVGRGVGADGAGEKSGVFEREAASGLQFGGDVVGVRHCVELVDHFRERRETPTQRAEIARVRAADADAREDALDVAHVVERVDDPRTLRRRVEHRADRLLAGGDVLGVVEREADPLPKHSPAHRGAGLIDRAEHAALDAAATGRALDLERAIRGRVDGDVLAGVVSAGRAQVADGVLLRLLEVAEDRADAEQGGVVVVLEAEAGGGVDVPVLADLLGRVVRRVLPAGAMADGTDAGRFHARRERVIKAVLRLGHQDLGGLESAELVEDRLLVAAHRPRAAGGQFDPREAGSMAVTTRDVERDGGEVVVGLAVEHRLVGQRAGRDQPRDVALDHALGGLRVLDLLGERNAIAGGDHPPQITLDRVERHARHRRGVLALLVARRDRDAEHPAGGLCVVPEHLVEVAHPEEQHVVRDTAA